MRDSTPAIGTTDPTTLLLVEESKINATDRALVMSAGDPALTLALARKAASVDVYDASFTALRRLHEQIQQRNLDNVKVYGAPFVASELYGQYDVAFLSVPKGRDFARAQLWSALQSLRSGGKVYIAGPTEAGARSVIEDAAILFGRCVTLMTRSRCRIGVSIRPATIPAYPADWGADPTIMQEQAFETPHGAITLATMPGLFSWEHTDEGTAFLLDNLKFDGAGSVLDVGCGNGIVGVLAARTAKAVLMVDDNLLAVACALRSIQLNGLTNAEAIASDVYETIFETVYENPNDQKFDLVVSNPPFHKSFDVNTNVAHRIMREAKKVIRPGGRLVIVANAFLRYEETMTECAKTSRVIARNSKYIVIEGTF